MIKRIFTAALSLILACAAVSFGTGAADSVSADTAITVTLADCERLTEIDKPNTKGAEISTKYVKEGNSSIRLTNGDIGVIVQFIYNEPINLTETFEGKPFYLEFWLYVPDPESITYREITAEISSDPSPDVGDRYNWNMSDIKWKEGWNRVSLPFDPNDKTGNPDPENIIRFRFVILSWGHAEVYLDDAVLTTVPKNVLADELGVQAPTEVNRDYVAPSAGDVFKGGVPVNLIIGITLISVFAAAAVVLGVLLAMKRRKKE